MKNLTLLYKIATERCLSEKAFQFVLFGNIRTPLNK